MKAYEGQLRRHKADLARFLRKPDTDSEVTRRTFAALRADIVRLTALAAQKDGDTDIEAQIQRQLEDEDNRRHGGPDKFGEET